MKQSSDLDVKKCFKVFPIAHSFGYCFVYILMDIFSTEYCHGIKGHIYFWLEIDRQQGYTYEK